MALDVYGEEKTVLLEIDGVLCSVLVFVTDSLMVIRLYVVHSFSRYFLSRQHDQYFDFK